MNSNAFDFPMSSIVFLAAGGLTAGVWLAVFHIAKAVLF